MMSETNESVPEVIWHYNLNGASIGPVGSDKVEKLLDDGTLTENTLVWNETFGSDWRRIGELPNFRKTNLPPPLPLSAINDFWVWLIALVPILGAFIETVMTSNDVNIGGALVGYAIANTIFAYLDEKSIKNSGRNSPTTWGLALLFVPAYLFIRAKRMGQNQIVLIVWVASVAAAVFVPQSLSTVYLGLSMPTCNSSVSVSKIKEIFFDLPINASKVSIIDLKKITTIQKSEKRFTCMATAVSSDGNSYKVQYSIDEKDNQYYYYLKIIGFDQ